MERYDKLVGSVLFLNSQVRTVNVTLFAIGSALDFIPFAENYRKAMDASLQSRRETGEGVRFSLRRRTLDVNRGRGVRRARARLSLSQSGKPISFIL